MPVTTDPRPTLTPADILLDRLHLIPDELVGRDQWLVWRAEERDGDTTKVPYQPRRPGSRAKVNDPATWSTFAQAVDTFAGWQDRPQPFSGIGYVFTTDDPYVGVDLDDCVESDTIHPAALALVRKLGGYAELSPSMEGLKVWTRGTLDLPGTGKATDAPWGGRLEVYHHGRWFAVTGMRLEVGLDF